MKKVVLSLTVMFLFACHIMAQTSVLKGTVTDELDGSPIPGVSVFVKGTTIGTVTTPDGSYTLNVPGNASTIVFSFVGMQTSEVAYTGQSTINVALKSESMDVDEVVVVAYGTAKKSSFTGSAATVKGDNIAKMQTSSVTQALAGTAAGLQVAGTGQPGSDASIRIRGIGSINAASSPLIVVDGVPYTGTISSINPQDIESLSVLKDAASAALYGSRAANGVVMITTKKGKQGKMQVNFDSRVGVNSLGVPMYDVMEDPGEYYLKSWEALGTQLGDRALASQRLLSELGGYNAYGGNVTQIVSPDGVLTDAPYLYNDNWFDEMFSRGIRQEYNLNFSGANDQTKYFMSLGYLNDEGIVANTGYERISTRANIEHNVTDWFQVGSNISYSRGIQSQPRATGSSNFSNPFMFAQNIAPVYPVFVYDGNGDRQYSDSGELLYDFGSGKGHDMGQRPWGANTNPASSSQTDLNETLNDNLSTRTFVKFDIYDGLSFTSNLGYDVRNRLNTTFYSPLHGDAQNVNGRSYKYSYRYETTTFNQLLNYNKTFGKHTISALAGHESYGYKMNYLMASKIQFLDPKNHELNNGAVMNDMGSYTNVHSIESYLGQLTYDYGGKYYFSASIRRDGSSKFHPDNRWGNFWSVGGSWRINQEGFLADVDWLDNLKLKSSYGVQGNDGILDNAGNVVYTPYMDLYNVINVDNKPALSLFYKGNPDLTWETSHNFNIGVEMSAYRNRLNVEFEYFVRNTYDLLFNNPVPNSTGIAYVPENIADMVNKGIDFTVGGDIIRRGGFTWNMSLNATHYKNEITRLPEDKREEGIIRGSKILQEDGSIYDFYMVKYAGVDETNGDALYWMKSTDTEGNTVWETTNEYDDALASSREVVGTSLPDLIGGVSTSLNYKGFDLFVQTAFQIGGKVYDSNYAGMMSSGRAGANWHTDIHNSWTPENTKTDVPRVEYGYQEANQQSDRFLTDASYFNIRNITLGYTFKPQLLNQMNIQSLRVYMAADNVALFSKRKGLDPRQFFDGSTEYKYNAVRTMSLGLNVTF
ncbi:TonB-dependent receptor [Carboxylicivirga mesophila]|uniref:TonB-dependent receptor n=1 Tax=Carboxylicivirga mesophila TaxID=1166478 RepID=A0ABS5KA40_9BACT|nr:TonB-dependent receptor [Carboxylicivirga mesophila]MBS2211899.1 TonB-dependent receptor [Carboxylicivirga mesophila]